MAQTAISLKLDTELLDQFDAACRGAGMDRSNALRSLMSSFIKAGNTRTSPEASRSPCIDQEARQALVLLKERLEALESRLGSSQSVSSFLDQF